MKKITKLTGDADIKLSVTDRYDAEVSLTTTAEAGKATATNVPLTYGSFDKDNGRNKIYIYAPKMIYGYVDSDIGAINALYAKCGLAPVSTMDSSDVKNPSVNPMGANAVGCHNP
jgi:hypothetical protein